MHFNLLPVLMLLLAVAAHGTTDHEGEQARDKALDEARHELQQAHKAVRQARKKLARLMEEHGLGNKERGFLGIVMVPTDDGEIRVARILEDAAAHRAGIEAGDVLLAINGTTLRTKDSDKAELAKAYGLLHGLMPGDLVTLNIRRNGALKTIAVTAGLRRGRYYCVAGDNCTAIQPEPVLPDRLPNDLNPVDREIFRMLPELEGELQGVLEALPLLQHLHDMPTELPAALFKGLELAELNPALGRYFGAEKGILVVNIEEDNSLDLHPGDVILKCDGMEVTRPSQIMKMLLTFREGDTVKLEILRSRRDHTIELKMPNPADPEEASDR